MKNRVTEERYGDVSRRVFLLLGSVLVLAGLVISNYSALIVRSHAAPLRSDSSGTSMIALSGDSVLQPSIELTSPAAAVGSTISVTTAAQGIADDGQCSLQEAIYSANFDFGVAPSSFNPIVTFDTGCEPGSGDDTIVLAAGQEYLMTEPLDDPYNPVGPTANPIVLSNMTIEANGSWLVRNNPFGDFTGPNFRAFAVARRTFADPSNDLGVQGAGIGNLTIRNAHIKGFTAKGGNGTDGGGGGLGAGGAIYVHDGRLLIDNSTFERNGAGGGNGSTRGRGYPGGGGGGIGGNGGSANYNNLVDIRAPGGGGGGARGDGADNGYYGDFHDGTKWVSAWLAWTHGGGGGGTLRNGGSGGYGQGRGFRCGGVGGDFQGDGGNGECPGGGGGGGGEPDVINVVDPDGDGGHGNYGGGGGGGGVRDSVALDGATGGRGGFGGGGGAGAREEYGFGNMESADGGRGGFGAGGGAGGSGGTGGVFGYFGGDGSGENGGGGAGLGGAIFSHKGTVRIRNSTFTGNYAVRGTAPDPLEDFGLAESGNDAGGAIFTLNGTLELFNSTIARNETTGDLGAVVVLSAYDQYFEIDPFNPVLPPNPPAALAVYNTIISNNGATSDGVVYTNTNGEVLATGLLITKAGSNNLILGNHANAAFRFPGVVSTSDPLLGPLQFNDPAGFTRTMALDPTSPAVNAGTDLMDEGITTDQRGVYRRPGAYDIGAYEVLDNTVPVAAAPSPAPSTNEDTAVAIGLSATDDDDDALTFTVTDGPDNGTLGVTTGSAVAADCTAANTCSLSVRYTPAANFNGSDSFKFKANDGLADSEEVTVAITVTPVNDAPVASATPLTQPNVQYSDPIQSVTITASDVETPAGSLTIAASYKMNGGSSVSGLPAGLAFTDNGVIGATRQWTVSGRANVPAGVYEISAAVTDRGDPDNVGTSPAISTSVSFTVNAIRENVVVTAANALSAVKVASPGGTSPQFELSASITEEDDGYPGDISKATPVTFMLTPIGGGSSPTCSNNTGSASGSTLSIECTFSSIPVGVYEVNIVVGGDYYTGGGSTVLTVYDPSLGFVSGGGWIINPDTGYRANYGVNVKYLKNGKAQGQVMYIEHRPTGEVKIKSNSMQNVAILTNEAQVTAKATYGDVGNYVVIARVIDNGEPGTNDKFGLKLLEPSGRAVADFTFLSSPVLIGGGNNQVPKKK